MPIFVNYLVYIYIYINYNVFYYLTWNSKIITLKLEKRMTIAYEIKEIKSKIIILIFYSLIIVIECLWILNKYII